MKERIALGFCNNVDYEIVWNADVLEDLIRRYKIRGDELQLPGEIRSQRDLLISILGFMKVAAGGERFVTSSAVIERFARRFQKKITLGGTSVRAAIAMRKFGYTSALHLITLNDHVRRLIPADSPYVCSNAHDSTHPHLIVQFRKGDQVRAGDIDIRASQPNRVIYHCNADRIAMKLSEEFADLITDAQVLLISGLNAIQSKPLLADRLQTLVRIMESLPINATVFFEDGGYYDPDHRRMIHRALGQRIDIYSLNEDELQSQISRKLALHNMEQLRLALPDLRRRIPRATIVLHTSNWALAYGDRAKSLEKALKAGTSLATTRFCFGDDFTVEEFQRIKSLPAADENNRFADAMNKLPGESVCCAPVADVEQTGGTTIGLGDAFVGGFLPMLLSET